MQTPVSNASAPPIDRRGRRRLLAGLGLCALLAFALALRLYGTDWDQGGLFHPDERAVLMRVNDLRWPAPSDALTLFSADESTLNPHWFNYGSLPMYVLKTFQAVSSPFRPLDIFDLRLPGRVISALADTATVALVFAIAARGYGRRAGFIAAALSALAVIQIQLAHFFAFDGVMTTFIVAGVFFSVRVAQRGRRLDSALAGLMLGLGMATKFSVAPLALTVVAAHAIFAFSRPGETLDLTGAHGGERGLEAVDRRRRALRGALMAFGIAAVAMLLTQPYMLLDYGTFARNVGEQSQMVRRLVDLPYTRQYVDTPKYAYQAWQLGVWGLGPAAGITVWAGLLAGLAAAALARRKTDLVVLSWVLPYLLVTGWFEVKFLRYMLPVTPFLAIYGARLLVWAGEGLQWLWPRRRWLVLVPAGLVLLLTMHYAMAFVAMYSGPHPAKAVSAWLDANAHQGAVVVEEHWEEGIPHVPGIVFGERLGIYEPDTPAKFDRIAAELARADYIVLYSNRLYGTVPRLPDRYPLTTRYYRALFDGSLGYGLVYSAQKSREFLGAAYRDDPFARVRDHVSPPAGWSRPGGSFATLDLGWADESFTVYDHPVSFVFENKGRLGEADLLNTIGGFQASGAPAQAEPGIGLLLSPGDALVQRAGGTWREIAFLRRLPGSVSWIVWLIGAQVMALAALPLAFAMFRTLPDRGYLFAKPLGILLASSVAWLLASLGWMKFSGWSVAVAIGLVALLSGAVWRSQKQEMRAFFRERRKFILFAEGLFLAAFLAFLAVRAANPDLWHPYRGGEKPMDFAYLNAVTRSSVMPPYDPWFAGAYLNYYYFGQFIVASLIRLTGAAPQVAYNLAVPLLFALTAAAAFSIVFNLVELTQRARGRPPFSTRSAVLAGVAGVVLVTVAGNIDGLVQLVQNNIGADAGAVPRLSFDFWRSSRMMVRDSPGNEITEFPFFTFLFADLHAHLIAMPFALLAFGLALSLFVRAGQRRPRLETWGVAAVLGVTVGALRIINTWDYPTALLLAALLVTGGELLYGRERPVRALLAAAGKLIFVVALGYIVFLPFHRNFELFNNGVEPSLTRTEAWRYLSVHSVFLMVVLGWLAFEWRDRIRRSRRALVDLSRGGAGGHMPAVLAVLLAATVVALAASGYGTVAFVTVAAVLLTVTVALAWATARERAAHMLPAVAAALVALLLGAAVEIWTVKGDIGRQNTVFKFYIHAWTLFGLASAYFLWLLGVNGKLALRRMSLRRGAWLAGLAVLAVGVMVYPALGTRDRLADRFDTSWRSLDGMEYMRRAGHFEKGELLSLRHDYEAIRWMQEEVDGSPVIIEGLAGEYRWGNRVSVYTGLPSVVGWDWHQRQQRVKYAHAVTQRRDEVNRFFTDASVHEAVRTLDRYGVRYVYVGQLEKVMYPPEGLAKFGQMAAQGLTPAYQNEEVTIYEYRPAPAGAAWRQTPAGGS